ncbi:hypothetical protein VTJ83DRAFT_1496 [Remersonia thermophila]|uniref:Uncharacterized protein n=1 Tax=Remersonia thermophila TaxID=72144 RepID=A0ABR4DIB7_9PEZI
MPCSWGVWESWMPSPSPLSRTRGVYEGTRARRSGVNMDIKLELCTILRLILSSFRSTQHSFPAILHAYVVLLAVPLRESQFHPIISPIDRMLFAFEVPEYRWESSRGPNSPCPSASLDGLPPFGPGLCFTHLYEPSSEDLGDVPVMFDLHELARPPTPPPYGPRPGPNPQPPPNAPPTPPADG